MQLINYKLMRFCPTSSYNVFFSLDQLVSCDHLPNKRICFSIGIRVSDSIDDGLGHIHHLRELRDTFSWLHHTSSQL